MDLYEYQARDLFAAHGVPVLPGRTAETPEEAAAAAAELGGTVVVKAQVKTGGRGKAGGVKLASSPEETQEKAAAILGMDIKGHTVHRVLVTEASRHRRGVLLLVPARPEQPHLPGDVLGRGRHGDRAAGRGAAGRAGADPGRCDHRGGPGQGRRDRRGRRGSPSAVADQAAEVIVKLWETFVGEDATLVEVNPLVRDPQDKVVALDGKVTLDGNADFRHPGHADLVDERTENPLEAKAKARNLNYVKLEGGQVGIIGNGAGLVMSTLDVVAYAGEQHGGVKPANFLDIGGGASAKVMADGLDVILRRPGREERVRQRVRRDHRVRRGGERDRRGAEDPRRQREQAAGRAAGRQQRGRGPADPGRGEPPAGHAGGHDGRRGRQGRRARRGRRASRHLDQHGRGPDMAIFLNEDSKVIVQGLTGAEGTKHATKMLAAGTNIVGGVNARKAGTSRVDRRAGPVGVRVGRGGDEGDRRGRQSSCSCRRAFAKGAVVEAIDAAIGLAVVITEGIPVHDSAWFWAHAVRERQPRPGSSARTARASSRPGSRTPGSSRPTSPGAGKIGLVSKSGTLTYQMMYELREIGFSTAIGIGGDPIIGTTHIDALEAFEADPETAAIVMIGEIGGDAEERAADFVKANVTKPVVGYVAGFTAPEGKTMGHAGAIVSGSAGTAQAKQDALEAAGVRVGKTPSEAAAIAREMVEAIPH